MKPRLSTFQIVLLVVFGALAVAGVLIFAFAIGGSGNASIGTVSVWGTLDATAFEVVLRQAADSDPRLNQVTYEQKDSATYEQDLTDALANGQGPDLFIMTEEYAVRDVGKIVPIPYASLSQKQFQDTFVQSADPFLSKSGVIAVPILADPLVLYFNRDMLQAAGFAQPPQYWDQLHDMAQKITKQNDAGVILKSAIALGEYRNVDNAKDILATLILQAGNTITTFDTSGRLVSALAPKLGGSSASESALRFYTEFADPAKVFYTWNRSLPEARQAFAAGDVALYIGYASELALIKRTNPNLNFATAPVPQASSKVLDSARVYGFATARTSKNPQGAVTVAYLLSTTDVTKAFATAYGIPSARRDVLSQTVQGDQGLFNRMAILSHSWIDPDPTATADMFRVMIEDTTSGSVLLTEAVQRADQTLGHILGL